MLKKPKNVRKGFSDTNTAWNYLKSKSSELKDSQVLTKAQLERLQIVKNKGKLSKAAQKQRKFLRKTLDASPYYYLLCAIFFSQNKLDSTKNGILDGLVEKIVENRDDTTIIHSGVRTLAVESCIPGAMRLLQEPNPGLGDASDLVLTNADLEGTREVFGESLSSKIRRATVQNTWKTAVTMDFPSWPTPNNPVPCLVSLGIQEQDVEKLVMALFKAKVDWVAGVLHIVHESGMTQIIRHSETTLKGVSDDVITAVFGPEIQAAITECPVRARELEEGKILTECVSMIVSRSEGTINLAVGIRRGLQIRKKLYD